jgi:hypothetical protein
LWQAGLFLWQRLAFIVIGRLNKMALPHQSRKTGHGKRFVDDATMQYFGCIRRIWFLD